MECAVVKTTGGLGGYLQARRRPMALRTLRGLRRFLRGSEPGRISSDEVSRRVAPARGLGRRSL
eukprot:573681-Pyramimonas_sp.AAC.1